MLSKPIIVIQTSENVTKLIGALLRYNNILVFLIFSLSVNTVSGSKKFLGSAPANVLLTCLQTTNC